MFNKLKQYKDLRDQAKKMQNALAGEIIEEEKNGVKVRINGNLEIISITLNSELILDRQADAVKEAINLAIKKMQKVMAQKIQEMGGLPKF